MFKNVPIGNYTIEVPGNADFSTSLKPVNILNEEG